MNNLVSIIEVPVIDFSRAVTFYQKVFDISIEKMEMNGNQMGIFPSEKSEIHLLLVKGEEYMPSTLGVVLYFRAGKDLQTELNKVVVNGGKVILPKTEISPEMGSFALFIDTEGNKIGLHSMQ